MTRIDMNDDEHVYVRLTEGDAQLWQQLLQVPKEILKVLLDPNHPSISAACANLVLWLMWHLTYLFWSGPTMGRLFTTLCGFKVINRDLKESFIIGLSMWPLLVVFQPLFDGKPISRRQETVLSIYNMLDFFAAMAVLLGAKTFIIPVLYIELRRALLEFAQSNKVSLVDAQTQTDELPPPVSPPLLSPPPPPPPPAVPQQQQEDVNPLTRALRSSDIIITRSSVSRPGTINNRRRRSRYWRAQDRLDAVEEEPTTTEPDDPKQADGVRVVNGKAVKYESKDAQTSTVEMVDRSSAPIEPELKLVLLGSVAIEPIEPTEPELKSVFLGSVIIEPTEPEPPVLTLAAPTTIALDPIVPEPATLKLVLLKPIVVEPEDPKNSAHHEIVSDEPGERKPLSEVAQQVQSTQEPDHADGELVDDDDLYDASPQALAFESPCARKSKQKGKKVPWVSIRRRTEAEEDDRTSSDNDDTGFPGLGTREPLPNTHDTSTSPYDRDYSTFEQGQDSEAEGSSNGDESEGDDGPSPGAGGISVAPRRTNVWTPQLFSRERYNQPRDSSALLPSSSDLEDSDNEKEKEKEKSSPRQSPVHRPTPYSDEMAALSHNFNSSFGLRTHERRSNRSPHQGSPLEGIERPSFRPFQYLSPATPCPVNDGSETLPEQLPLPPSSVAPPSEDGLNDASAFEPLATSLPVAPTQTFEEGHSAFPPFTPSHHDSRSQPDYTLEGIAPANATRDAKLQALPDEGSDPQEITPLEQVFQRHIEHFTSAGHAPQLEHGTTHETPVFDNIVAESLNSDEQTRRPLFQLQAATQNDFGQGPHPFNPFAVNSFEQQEAGSGPVANVEMAQVPNASLPSQYARNRNLEDSEMNLGIDAQAGGAGRFADQDMDWNQEQETVCMEDGDNEVEDAVVDDISDNEDNGHLDDEPTDLPISGKRGRGVSDEEDDENDDVEMADEEDVRSAPMPVTEDEQAQFEYNLDLEEALEAEMTRPRTPEQTEQPPSAPPPPAPLSSRSNRPNLAPITVFPFTHTRPAPRPAEPSPGIPDRGTPLFDLSNVNIPITDRSTPGYRAVTSNQLNPRHLFASPTEASPTIDFSNAEYGDFYTGRLVEQRRRLVPRSRRGNAAGPPSAIAPTFAFPPTTVTEEPEPTPTSALFPEPSSSISPTSGPVSISASVAVTTSALAPATTVTSAAQQTQVLPQVQIEAQASWTRIAEQTSTQDEPREHSPQEASVDVRQVQDCETRTTENIQPRNIGGMMFPGINPSQPPSVTPQQPVPISANFNPYRMGGLTFPGGSQGPSQLSTSAQTATASQPPNADLEKKVKQEASEKKKLENAEKIKARILRNRKQKPSIFHTPKNQKQASPLTRDPVLRERERDLNSPNRLKDFNEAEKKKQGGERQSQKGEDDDMDVESGISEEE